MDILLPHFPEGRNQDQIVTCTGRQIIQNTDGVFALLIKSLNECRAKKAAAASY